MNPGSTLEPDPDTTHQIGGQKAANPVLKIL